MFKDLPEGQTHSYSKLELLLKSFDYNFVSMHPMNGRDSHNPPPLHHAYDYDIKEIKQFIIEAISEVLEDVEKVAIENLTSDIRKAEFIGSGQKVWQLSDERNDRGIEPCIECANKDNIKEFLKTLKFKSLEWKK
jgi:hypothetical protein